MDHSPYIEVAAQGRDHSSKVLPPKCPSTCSVYRGDDSRQETADSEDPRSDGSLNDHDPFSIRRELPSLIPRRRKPEESIDLPGLTNTRNTLEEQWVIKRCDAWSQDSMKESDFIHPPSHTKENNDTWCFQRHHSILADSPGRSGEGALYLEDRLEDSIPLPSPCTAAYSANDLKHSFEKDTS